MWPVRQAGQLLVGIFLIYAAPGRARAEAKSLFEAMQPSTCRQQCRLGGILAIILAKLGVTAVELSSKGENDLT